MVAKVRKKIELNKFIFWLLNYFIIFAEQE